MASQLSPHIQVSPIHTHLHAYRQEHKQPQGLENIHKIKKMTIDNERYSTANLPALQCCCQTIVVTILKTVYTLHIYNLYMTHTILQIYKTIANTRIINVYGYRCYDSGKHQWLAGIFPLQCVFVHYIHIW